MMKQVKHSPISYKQSGVNYDTMDVLKRMAQIGGKNTVKNLKGTGYKEVSKSRGESAYIQDIGDKYLVMVQEGLGTKSLIADEMYKRTGKSYYDALAQDTVAMIVNDLITVGAKPQTILAYWGLGSASWFDDRKRMEDLVDGWTQACNLSGAVWGGGETCTVPGVIERDVIDLAGSCVGFISPKSRLSIGDKLRPGDHIILFASSGIHANGVTLARKISESLPDRYMTKLPSGTLLGEALLTPTIIYAKLIQDIFQHDVQIKYMTNITGHGWRKLMRLSKPYTYRMLTLPPVPEVLQFICENGPIDPKEAYGNYNMGAGYAIFVSEKDVQSVLKVAKKHKISAYVTGIVEDGEKQVIIEPLKLKYSGNSLQVRV